MGSKNLHFFNILILLIVSLPTVLGQTKDNLDYLVNNVSEGKTYFLSRANSKTKHVMHEKNGYYVKLVPAKYKIVKDTIELAPALNGNLDTSNYFIETEVLVLKEPAAEWKTARVSEVCMNQGVQTEAALCLLKMVPKYQIVNKKFFPFKNILDTTNTDFVIPAKYVVVDREVLEKQAKLERYALDNKPNVNADEKLIKIEAGKWQRWKEVECPYGEFNDPKITDIQNALKDRGYSVKVTNQYDEQTRRSLHQFQLDNMLEVGELSDETIKRLGVERERLITVEN